MKPTDDQVVALICWENWPSRERNKVKALKSAKVHMGTYNRGHVQSLCLRSHGTYNDFDERQYKVFSGRVDEDRICKFCLDKDPSFWEKLQQTEPVPDLEYFIIDFSRTPPEIVSTPSKRSASNILQQRPDHIESINKDMGQLYLIKGYLVDVDVSVRKIVEGITVKE